MKTSLMLIACLCLAVTGTAAEPKTKVTKPAAKTDLVASKVEAKLAIKVLPAEKAPVISDTRENEIRMPTVKKGITQWSSRVLGCEDCRQLAIVYDDYKTGRSLMTKAEKEEIAAVLRLLATPSGNGDSDLQQLLYYLVFKDGLSQPATGLLQKKVSFVVTVAPLDSDEGSNFAKKIATTEERYGLQSYR